jgi:transposase
MERAEAEAILDGDRETALALLRRVGELIEANRRLESHVTDLEQRLNRTSRNSSLPPSADPPSAPPRPRQAASGRRPGAQPGHPGRGRRLAPIESVDELIDHWPRRCRCGHLFCTAEREAAGEPARHQVAELPSIAILLTEHRLQRLRCPDCGATTRAQLPAGVPPGAFSPRLQAAVATLAVRNRVSRRDTTELLRELFGAEISTGSVNAIVSRAGEALEGAYAHLHEELTQAAAINIDETGWRTAGKRRTLWGMLSASAALFRIAANRHQREAKALLGEDFAGIGCSDRRWAYDYLDPERRQLCWAHLVRDFTAHSEGVAGQKEFGEACLKIAGRLFAAWDHYRRDGDHGRLIERIAPLKEELRALLEHAARKSARNRHHRTFAKNLLKRWLALWTFASVPGVEPTNNHAERGLRGAVIYRKLSLGSQSEGGERIVERLLSASITCRLQERSLFAYLSDVLAARIRGDPIPLLA